MQGSAVMLREQACASGRGSSRQSFEEQPVRGETKEWAGSDSVTLDGSEREGSDK